LFRSRLAWLGGRLDISGLPDRALPGAACRKSFRTRVNRALVVETLEDRCLLSLNLIPYVNPFIGTNPAPTAHYGFSFDAGDVFPGPTTPEGMVQFSPDTTSNIAGGYYYPDNIIKSFSLDHFSGRGIPYEGDIGLMPIVGGLSASSNFSFSNFRSTFLHANEGASLGYYRVLLDSGPTVELTDAPHTGVMQVTFPASAAEGTLLFNIGNSVQGVSDGQVDIVNGSEVTGWAQTTIGGDSRTYRIYFSAVFDQPVTAFGVWNGSILTPGQTSATGGNTGGYVTFDTSANSVVHATVGISFVSVANAQLNRAAEVSDFNFAGIQLAAQTAWNNKLNAIQVPDGLTPELTTFYTALYHTLIQPNIFDDVNGEYIGFDNKVHTVASGHHHYANIPGWDNYRSEDRLLGFLFPNEASDIAQSLVDDAAQGGGGIGRWLQENRNSNGMVGDGNVAALASFYAFGARNFDTEAALAAMENNANVPGTLSDGHIVRSNLTSYVNNGFVGLDESGTAAADTLEYANVDFALAQYAQALGVPAAAELFYNGAQNWRNLFNPATGYLQPRFSNGTFLQGPPSSTVGWSEGTTAQYTWLVPYDVRGLANAIGGDAATAARLDDHFQALNAGPSSANFYMGNEPGEEAPWTYDFIGEPFQTQSVARRIQTQLFTATPGGLPGNDDAGSISSWYVFSVLGLYPDIPGVGGFVIGSPLFQHIKVTLETGQTLIIRAPNAADSNPYVQSLSVDGNATTSTWLPLDTILNSPSTRLTFALGPTPSSWGTGLADAPPSFDLPFGFTDTDIGSPSQAGSASYDWPAGAWTVSGGGAGISGTSDQFHYASRNSSGDATVFAEVTGITNTDDGAQAGVMFRDSSAADSMEVALVATQADGVVLEWRDATGGDTSTEVVSGIPAPSDSNPVWVELIKSGTTYSGFYSTGGSTWIKVGAPVTVSFSNSVYLAGLAVTANNDSALNTATFRNVSVAAPASPLDLSANFNRTGIVDDGSIFSSMGGIDGNGFAISEALVGPSLTWNGMAFDIGPAGSDDVVSAAGQTIPVPQGSYTTFQMLALGVNGNQPNESFMVSYTDGTTQTFTQSISDWATPQSFLGESRVLTMPYRDRFDGTMDSSENHFIYGYSFGLFTTKTVQSITLPSNPNVEVLAIDVVSSGSAPAGPSESFNAIGMLANRATSVPSNSLLGSGNSAQQVGARASTVSVAYVNRTDGIADNRMSHALGDSVPLNRGKALQRIAPADDGEVELLATTLAP
jgi:predicted alpha-1,2-mannosidase